MKIPIDPLKISPLISFLYRTWVRTLRYDDQGEWEKITTLHSRGRKLILCLWHEELFALTGFGTAVDFSSFVTFVSQSKDGEIIARALETMGHRTARGSSSRGGVRALLLAKRIMERENRVGVFTVDGPRGPRRVPKDGPIFLAQKAGALLVPMRAHCSRKKVFEKSWDHFQVPVPFSRCNIRIGEPLEITSEKLDQAVLDAERERLQKALNLLGDE